MRGLVISIIGVAAWMASTAFAGPLDAHQLDITNAKRAEFNWKMNCQGCHGVQGMGSPGGAPEMLGVLDRFLTVEGGRAYLASVPGVAYAPLNDDELADLLNWMLNRFACDVIPTDFSEYSSEEVAAFRENVLITDAHIVRAKLLSNFEVPTPANSGECLSFEQTVDLQRRAK